MSRWSESLFASRRTLAVGVVLFVVMAVVPFVTTAYQTTLAMTALVFVMLAVSWNLLAGYAGQISLGHAAFFGMGAYVAAWLTKPGAANLPSWISLHPIIALNPVLGLLVAMILGGLASAVLALAVGPMMFRLRGHYFAIGTLALAAIIRLVMTDQRTLSGGSTGYYPSQVMGATDTYLVTLFVAAAITLASYFVVNSRLGLGMQAINDDEVAASGLGVSPLRYKMYAFVLTSFMAGIAGSSYALNQLYINPTSTLGVNWTVQTLVVVVLGGMGTLAGPLFGTVVFVVIDNLLSSVVGSLATTVEGIIIILFVILLPSGVYGYARSYLAEGTDREPALTEA